MTEAGRRAYSIGVTEDTALLLEEVAQLRRLLNVRANVHTLCTSVTGRLTMRYVASLPSLRHVKVARH